MRLTRRFLLSLASIAVLPASLHAVTCEPLLTGLLLCDADGWRLASVEGETVSLTHTSGIAAVITLRTGLTEDEMFGERWMVTHAPISARATVLEVGLASISERVASTSVYLPRHLSPPEVVALSAYRGTTTSLVVSTRGPGETYSDQHREAHDGLLAALQLDLPE
jgi:hypothetical protein